MHPWELVRWFCWWFDGFSSVEMGKRVLYLLTCCPCTCLFSC